MQRNMYNVCIIGKEVISINNKQTSIYCQWPDGGIVLLVKSGQTPSYDLHIPEGTCAEGGTVIEKLVERGPWLRLRQAINEIEIHNNLDLVESLIQRLTRYICNLVEQVVLWPIELKCGKHKVDNILKQLLLHRIAHCLVMGKHTDQNICCNNTTEYLLEHYNIDSL